ncbi:MAG: leucyl aminopeptidase [bacterium]
MNYDTEFNTGPASDRDVDLVIFLVGQDEDSPDLSDVPDLPEEPLKDFDANKNDVQVFYDGDFVADRLALLGIGDESDLDESDLTELAGKAQSVASDRTVEEAELVFPLFLDVDREKAAQNLVLGMQLAGYDFDQYKTDGDDAEDGEESTDDDVELESFDLLLEDRRSATTVSKGLERAKKLAVAMTFSRDLGNTPANELVPDDLASEAESLASEYDTLKTTVWDESDLEDDGMNLILAVGKGSENPPRLAKITHEPGDYKAELALAGKGVTFDTGGISIKPSKKMHEMKFDMCGAAAVLGTMRAVAEIGLPLKVHGFVPSAENMPGQRAVKPGDVVTGYFGKSVEVINTDAEGRLLLADTLGYISEELAEDLDCLVDFATLTGACITALGHSAAGLMGLDDELCSTLEEAGQSSNEPVWQLPLWEEYSEKLESDVADVKNIGGDAGAITAGAFLREFVDEEKIDQWAHLDIAGTGWGMKQLSYRPKGGTGFGVHLMDEFFRDHFSLDG